MEQRSIQERETAALLSLPHRKAAAAVLIVAAVMDMIDATVVNVALPTIQKGLHASPTALEWVAAGYMLTFAAFLIPAGSLGDLLGRRRVFIIGIAVFGAASLAAGLSETPAQLVVGRLVQGTAAAAMTPQILATFRSIFTGKERGAVFAVYGAVLGLAAGVGLIIGGALTQANLFGWHWRSIFFVNVPVAAATLVCAAVVVPETRDPSARRPDVIGGLTLAAAVAAIAYPLLEGRREGWPAWIFALLAAGVAALVLVAVTERRRVTGDIASLLRPRLLSVPSFSIGLAVQFIFSAALQGFSVIFTIWLQAGQHFSPLRAGLTFVAFSVGSFLAAPFSVELAHRWGRYVLASGGVMLAVGVAGVDIGAHHVGGRSPWPLVPGLVVAGAGLAFLVIPLVNVVLAAVPGRAAGGASGLFSTAQQLGGGVGVAVVGTIFFSHASSHGLHGAFTRTAPVVVLIYAAAAAGALLLPGRGVTDEEAIEAEAIEV